ncbi:MAG TPA: metallophosphoesterase [Pseudonocardia sp.]|jgi:3',5'-cyclic AMP phosphodiesterase CpdA|uniref:metallophosphoesterase n=1 Tax=Pseudonocardia sp. TaxID=60912 RepID=UPI002EDA7365
MAAEPAYTLIQITDVHIRAADEAAGEPVDTLVVLSRALDAVMQTRVGPAAVLFTGDLVEHGRPEEYQRLRSLVEPAIARIGAPAVYLAGNHDERAALREHLLGEPPSSRPLDQVRQVGGLRVIAMDSTVPGRAYGELSGDQLAWLRAELATPAPDGTILALHHPPLPTAVPLSGAIELRNRDELAQVIAGTDVRVVLAGHTHVVSAGVLAGVPVWTGGGIAPTIDSLEPDGALRGLSCPSVSRIDLFDNSALISSIPFDAGEVAYVPSETMRPRIAELQAQLPTG